MNKPSALSALSGLALAVCVLILAAFVFTAQSAPDLSGKWNSNIGVVYEIQQSGSQFTWSVPSLNQSGTGTVSENNVTMSGPGWTVKGTITEKDASGKPTKIVGENGVVLLRTAGAPLVSAKPPAQPPVTSAPKAPPAGAISLSGKWNSSIGAAYEIQQSGSQFTWSAPSLSQSGTGTISGNNITLSGPGWTVKGMITETDSSGNPTKIVGENGVVLFRTLDGQPGAVPPPAQQSGPQGSAPTAATGDWPKFKDIPPLLPQVLTQVSAPATRRATIEALSASPTTKSTLEKVAASAGKTVNGLKEQTLSGKPAVDAPISPSSKPAQAFLDLWKAPVRFSPTIPGPSYLDGGSTYVVGGTEALGVYVGVENTLQTMAQKDYFYMPAFKGIVRVIIHLPPEGGQYMLAIHAADENGDPGDPAWWAPIGAVAEATVFTPTEENKVSLVRNSAGTGLVGMFADSPANQGWGEDKALGLAHRSIILELTILRWAYYMGVTVTRL
jgi:hypothetical protein